MDKRYKITLHKLLEIKMSIKKKLYSKLEMLTLFFLRLQGVGVEVDQQKEINLIQKCLKKEPLCIFDVGANKGQYALALCSVFKNSTIHSFEPSPTAFSVAQKNLKTKTNIILNNIGFSDKIGNATLYSDIKGSGLASLSKRRLCHFDISFEEQEKIWLTTIDNYCQNNNINHIDLLKIDAEGHELSILNGAEAMFKNKNIDLVQFEFGGCNIDSKTYFQDFYYLFNNLGYDIFRMTNTSLLHIDSYKEYYEIPIYQNLLAVKK